MEQQCRKKPITLSFPLVCFPFFVSLSHTLPISPSSQSTLFSPSPHSLMQFLFTCLLQVSDPGKGEAEAAIQGRLFLLFFKNPTRLELVRLNIQNKTLCKQRGVGTVTPMLPHQEQLVSHAAADEWNQKREEGCGWDKQTSRQTTNLSDVLSVWGPSVTTMLSIYTREVQTSSPTPSVWHFCESVLLKSMSAKGEEVVKGITYFSQGWQPVDKPSSLTLTLSLPQHTMPRLILRKCYVWLNLRQSSLTSCFFFF